MNSFAPLGELRGSTGSLSGCVPMWHRASSQGTEATAGAWWLIRPDVGNPVPALRDKAGRRTLRRQGSILGCSAINLIDIWRIMNLFDLNLKACYVACMNESHQDNAAYTHRSVKLRLNTIITAD